MRKYFQIQVQPWEAERLKVLIGRSRFKGVELRSVTAQLERVINEYREDVVAEFTKAHRHAPASHDEAEEWATNIGILDALSPGWRERKHRFRTVEGGRAKKEGKD